MLRAAALGLAALLLTTPARADEPDAVTLRTQAARNMFLAGKAAYEHGDYEQALREFSDGYRLSPRPEFLLNIAQSYNKLGKRDEAIQYYESFLAADANSPFADIARENLTQLKRERAAAAPPSPSGTATAPPPSPPANALTASPGGGAISARPAPPRHSARWHLAWALPVAAVVIAGAALGIYFGTRGPSCDPRTCIDVTHAR